MVNESPFSQLICILCQSIIKFWTLMFFFWKCSLNCMRYLKQEVPLTEMCGKAEDEGQWWQGPRIGEILWSLKSSHMGIWFQNDLRGKCSTGNSESLLCCNQSETSHKRAVYIGLNQRDRESYWQQELSLEIQIETKREQWSLRFNTRELKFGLPTMVIKWSQVSMRSGFGKTRTQNISAGLHVLLYFLRKKTLEFVWEPCALEFIKNICAQVILKCELGCFQENSLFWQSWKWVPGEVGHLWPLGVNALLSTVNKPSNQSCLIV